MGHSSNNEHLALRIHAERVKTVYQQAMGATISQWVTGLLFAFVPNPNLERSVLLTWVVGLTLVSILRMAVIQIFKRQSVELERYKYWGWAYAGAIFSSSLVWAFGLLLLPTPGDLVYQMMLMMILIAMCVGACYAGMTYFLMGLVYFIPVMSVFIFVCIMTGGLGFYIFAATGTSFLITNCVVCKSYSANFVKNLVTRFELAERKEEAEHASLAKTKFLAAASHDLRQPLHALTLFTGLLRGEVTNPKALNIVDNIDASVGGLQDLFNSLLDFSKLEAGTLTIQKQNFQVSSILDPIANEFQFEAEQYGLSFYVEPCPKYVYTDATLLSRIVKNLVSNALRYTTEGSIVVLSQRQGDFLALEVRDTGIGIPEEHREEVFQEFIQLHNPERDRSKGLGLGLSIVRGLADLLNIEIRMESKSGTGTSFFVTIPLGEAPSNKIDQQSVRQPASELMLDDLRVVFIDDELQIREGTQQLLESWGCDVRGFDSCQSALDSISSESFIPHVVLTDYRLEGHHTGLEAIKAINEWLGYEVQAAIITGDTAPDRLKEAEASGHILLHKPVKPMQLRSYLTRMKNKLVS